MDLAVRGPSEAIEKINWYAMRWKIEVFHKILKSGCKAEDSKLRTAERLANQTTLDSSDDKSHCYDRGRNVVGYVFAASKTSVAHMLCQAHRHRCLRDPLGCGLIARLD
ncbi:hypothetical protein QNJ95_43990 [Bradyrhizobium elkanii]|uniref:hypothetical protein n=1 Tax=Bradyrhizobium elkanii TaxID=29448 RepID=UPI002711D58C|nr:hypothetical protein [Bradyrhizobium elkanii]WLA39726.1 hypothetical protein QNJ95_43990 [Bradyrhizobium elkanii]